MTTLRFPALVLIVACAPAFVAGSLVAAERKAPAAAARVTMSKARATALKVRPGQITDAELEREKGGSGLRYSFDIKNGAKKYEVGIDAKSGALLENKVEGPNPD